MTYSKVCSEDVYFVLFHLLSYCWALQPQFILMIEQSWHPRLWSGPEKTLGTQLVSSWPLCRLGSDVTKQPRLVRCGFRPSVRYRVAMLEGLLQSMVPLLCEANYNKKEQQALLSMRD